MRIIQWFKEEVVDTFVSRGQGIEAGEEWIEQGGEPPTADELHRFFVTQQIETPDWRAFNRGFRSVVGDPESEDEEL